MLTRLAISVALVAGLTACQPAPETPDPIPPSDECGASALQSLIGQPKSMLATIRLSTSARIIGPEDAVTADYRPERLNIEYDKDDVIRKVSCY